MECQPQDSSKYRNSSEDQLKEPQRALSPKNTHTQQTTLNFSLLECTSILEPHLRLHFIKVPDMLVIRCKSKRRHTFYKICLLYLLTFFFFILPLFVCSMCEISRSKASDIIGREERRSRLGQNKWLFHHNYNSILILGQQTTTNQMLRQHFAR